MDLKQIEKLMIAMGRNKMKRIVIKREGLELELERDTVPSIQEPVFYDNRLFAGFPKKDLFLQIKTLGILLLKRVSRRKKVRRLLREILLFLRWSALFMALLRQRLRHLLSLGILFQRIPLFVSWKL